MGADKNSSLKRELDPHPKFTTKDSHTSLPRSRSHYGPSNPRNKPQMIPKRKHEPRSKGLSCPMNTLAYSPRPRGGWSAVTGRTVRYPRADDPLNVTERSDKHPNTQTVRTWSSDSLRATHAAWTVRGLWADGPAHTRIVCDPYADGPTNPFQPETDDQTNQNEDAQEHTTNTKNPRPKKVRVDYPPGPNRVAHAPNREHNLSYPSMDLPNGLSS
jgi:hypothetical protein